MDIIFLPGLLCTSEIFSYQMAHLPVGFGAVPVALSNHPSMRAIAHEILSGLTEPVILCGLSMGGIIAMEMVAQRADLIAGLILLDTNALDESPDVSRSRDHLVGLADAEGPGIMSVKKLMRVLVHPSREKDSRFRDIVYEMAEVVGYESFEAHASALASRVDYTETLKKFSKPVKIIYGDSDQLTPEPRQRHLASILINNSVSVIPECGHLSSLEEPQKVSDAINLWLSSIFKE